MAKQMKKPVSPHTWVWVDQEDKTMNVKKQSSIDWLVEQLKPAIALQEKYINEFLQQAKAMHKEEIIDSYCYGYLDMTYNDTIFPRETSEQYYKEKFGGQDE